MKKVSTIKLETVFKIIYLIHLLFAFNGIINQTAILKVTLIMSMGVGAVAGILKLWKCKKYFKYTHFWILNAFLVSYVVSTVLNMKYGILDNLQGFVWLTAQIWILYLVNIDMSIQDIKKEFKILGMIYLVFASVANFVSLGMFFVGYTYRNFDTGKKLGFLWGRLWGVYDDPNHGSIIAMIAIVIAIYLYNTLKSVKARIALILSSVINGLYIYLSDSRTGILCIAVGIGIMSAVLYWWKTNKTKTFFAIILSLACIMVIVFVEVPIQKVMGVIVQATSGSIDFDDDNSQEEDTIVIGREETESDPSNRRFDIWESGLRLVKEQPIYGIGRFNFVNFARAEVPDAYIVNNDLQDFDSMHNMPLDVFVSQGVIGIAILGVVIIQSIVVVIKGHGIVKREHRKLVLTLFVLLVMNAMSSLFVSTVIYINSPATGIFWLSFGYFFRILELEKDEV